MVMVGAKTSRNPGAKDVAGNSTKINAQRGKTVIGITGANIAEFGVMVTTIARNDWERPGTMEMPAEINRKVKNFLKTNKTI